jgi:citrate synthase
MLHELFNRPQHAELLGLLAESHYRAALDNANTSSAVAVAVYAASGRLCNAIAAASLAQGGLHAPIAQARALFKFRDPVAAAMYLRDTGQRVPGFGNSFYKDRIDPAFSLLFQSLPAAQKVLIAEINTEVLPKLFPNAAIITAAVCEVADIPNGAESTIFVHCRTPAWTKLCLQQKLPKVAAP